MLYCKRVNRPIPNIKIIPTLPKPNWRILSSETRSEQQFDAYSRHLDCCVTIFLILKPYSRKIKNLKCLRFPSTSSKNSRKCSDFVILFLSSICWYAQANTPALFVYYWIFNHLEIILWNSFKVFQNLQKLEPPQNRANFAESLN